MSILAAGEGKLSPTEKVVIMGLQALFFYIFAFVAIASAFMVIAARNPVHSVLFLILCFFNSAGIFLILGAEFLAFILVIVYVGAVAVLFLFVVMMLDVEFKSISSTVCGVDERSGWFSMVRIVIVRYP